MDLTDKTVRISPPLQHQRSAKGCQGLNVSPDGKWIAVTGLAGGRTMVFDSGALDAPPRAMEAERRGVDTVCVFDPRGGKLFAGNEDGAVRVFDPATGRERAGESWYPGNGVVTALAIPRDGSVIAVAAIDLQIFSADPPPNGTPRRERLRVPAEMPRNWIAFGAGDGVLLQSRPWHCVEVWSARATESGSVKLAPSVPAVPPAPGAVTNSEPEFPAAAFEEEAMAFKERTRALTRSGRLADADALCVARLKRVRHADGSLPPEQEQTLRSHIEVLRNMQDLPRAEAALRELISMVEKLHPEDIQRFGDMSNLASVLIPAGRPADAIPILEKAIAGLSRPDDAAHPVVTLQLQRAISRLEAAKAAVK